MKFIIMNQDNKEILSTHDTIELAQEAFVPYFQECCSEKKRVVNWIFKQKNSGAIDPLNRKETFKAKTFLINS